jgi:NAD(P)-dependent dehydrogenase (short-subunit alcohol dehydrogenase family)
VSAERLLGRIAIVTGAGQGIGRAIAARFLDEGAKVALLEVDAAKGEDAYDDLSTQGPVHLEIIDVADEASVTRAVAATVAWGGELDVVVNNAATVLGFGRPAEALDPNDFRRVLEVNLVGPMLLARSAAPFLRRRGGAIINITSTRAVMSEPNTEAYAASKGGLAALTHALAVSLGPAVRVNAIAPGWIATDAWRTRAERCEPALSPVDHAQHPAGRVGRPEDVAALAVYLASEEAGFVTGQSFTIDGGMTRKMIYAE